MTNINPSCTTTDSRCYTQLNNEAAKPFKFPVLYLNQMPGAMDKMGWRVAAAMMRNWFSNPAWRMPSIEREGNIRGKKGNPIIYSTLPPTKINETIIKMQWALAYPQVQKALKHLREHNNWCTEKGMELLVKRLKNAGWIPGVKRPYLLGNPNNSASVLDNTCQVNYKGFGEYMDTLDDFYGAIFKATLKVAVVGHAAYDPDIHMDFFKVDKMGFYLRDTYDFNTERWEDPTIGLGIWSKDRMLSKAETGVFMSMRHTLNPLTYSTFLAKYSGFVHVRNSDFYRWADKHGTGGDYYVFSDVLWETPTGENAKSIPLVLK
jgi:hypothetical protein